MMVMGSYRGLCSFGILGNRFFEKSKQQWFALYVDITDLEISDRKLFVAFTDWAHQFDCSLNLLLDVCL